MQSFLTTADIETPDRLVYSLYRLSFPTPMSFTVRCININIATLAIVPRTHSLKVSR